MKATTNKDKLSRAYKYAKALVAFQNIGEGLDSNLKTVREVSYLMRWLCESETGVVLDTYPTDFVRQYEKKEGDV